jgi:hypothetical protein
MGMFEEHEVGPGRKRHLGEEGPEAGGFGALDADPEKPDLAARSRRHGGA